MATRTATEINRHDPDLFDYNEAVLRCGSELDVFHKMVDYFFEETTTLLPKIRLAAHEGRVRDAAVAAHRYHGTLIYLAAPRALAAIEVLEQAVRGASSTLLAAAVAQIEHEIGQLQQVLLPHRIGKA